MVVLSAISEHEISETNMDKFSVDYSELQQKIEAKQAFRLDDVRHLIRKVAFDVVRFVDSNDTIDGLWQIQEMDDGEYIVAMYEDKDADDPVEKTASTKSDWSVFSDRSNENLNIFYKDTPITRVCSSSLGISQDEVSYVCSYLPYSLASNENLVAGLLSDMSPERRKEVFEKFPELSNFAGKDSSDDGVV
jgi:hypothetical protein